jgi:hypothetical protein
MMRRLKLVQAGLLSVLGISLSSCTSAPEMAVSPPPVSHPATACRTRALEPPIKVLFLAREAVADELQGLEYFVRDWGKGQSCFDGRVVTSLSGTDLKPYQVLVVDISHDQRMTTQDATALAGFLAAGKRAAIFAYPMRLKDRSVIDDQLGGLPSSFGVGLSMASGCGDWHYQEMPVQPFNLSGSSYRYENFGGAIFTVHATGPQRTWANTLFCPNDPSPVILELRQLIVAGFSIAYSVSLADDNVRAVQMKELVVDVVHELTVGSGL